MGDHQLQKQPVESRALRCGELGHLLRRRHAGHLVVGVHRLVRGRIRHPLTALTQPLLHELDLVSLRGVDTPGDVDQLGQVGAVGHQCRHFDGLVMVRNHVLHEQHISWRVARIGNFDRLLGTELSRWLARSARLNDRRLGDGDGRQAQP